MNLIRKKETNRVANSPVVTVVEYAHTDPEINLSLADIHGRYPDSGFVMNEKSKELVFVTDGRVNLILSDRTIELYSGDSVIIDRHEKYAWNGVGKIMMVCTPAWEPSQHKEVK